MKSLLILPLCVLALLCQTQGCLGCLEQERLGLLELKAARIMGNHSDPFDLLTWVDDKKSSDYCAWERVSCSNTSNRVIQLSLSTIFLDNNFLNASWFSPFKELRYLDLSENRIGAFEEMQLLINLRYFENLNLAANSFNQSILLALGAYTSLKSLNLSRNEIGWEERFLLGVYTNLSNVEVLDLSDNYISTFEGLSNMTKLRILNLTNNYIPGPIPSSMFHLNDLEALFLRKNWVDGSLSGFCEMKSLQILDLFGNRFEGTLPTCLKNLTTLRKLDVSQNQFVGNLPPSLISNLTSLEYISFSNNQFDGAHLFTSLTNHKSQFDYLGFSNCRLNASVDQLLRVLYNQHELTGIELSHNNLHGNFPNWLVKNNTKLETLLLRNNSLEGQVHFPLHRPTNFKWIDISMNRIRGQLQDKIGHILPKIIVLNIAKNVLEGRVPDSIGKMKDLERLYLSSNNLVGKIPNSLGLCRKLSVLLLSNNRLDGHIPLVIFNLTNLAILKLSTNRLTGDISDSRIKFPKYLETLDIGNNNISGRLPSRTLNIHLVELFLQNNSFHGPIPPELCHIFSLDLSQNQLSGHIPLCLLEISSLHLQHNKLTGTIPKARRYPGILDLSHNNLSGSIPDSIGFSDHMNILLLRGNRLSGSVPHSLCWLNKISLMDLSHNMLFGPIPPCFSNITLFGKIGATVKIWELGDDRELLYFEDSPYSFYLNPDEEEFVTKSRLDSYKVDIFHIMGGLDLSCNKLTGEIPHEIGALIAIHTLNFSHNHLTGSIPKTLSNMKQIESLDLSHNKLGGEIPLDITAITTLEVFTVAYNNLSGQVPDMKAQFATFNETCYEGNPFLCGPPLRKQCNSNPTAPTTVTVNAETRDELWMDLINFFASFGAAYIMCLLGMATTLYINPYWRRIWFDFADKCLSCVFPFWSEAIYNTRNPLT